MRTTLVAREFEKNTADLAALNLQIKLLKALFKANKFDLWVTAAWSSREERPRCPLRDGDILLC